VNYKQLHQFVRVRCIVDLHAQVVSERLEQIGREHDGNVGWRHFVNIRALADSMQKSCQVLDSDSIADRKKFKDGLDFLDCHLGRNRCSHKAKPKQARIRQAARTTVAQREPESCTTYMQQRESNRKTRTSTKALEAHESIV
jgi:hypothetical protein